jgi:WD40 repeat protein
VGSDDHICRIFEIKSGREVKRFSLHKNRVFSGTFSTDGRMVATGGGDGNEIYLWDPSNADVLHKLTGNGSSVWAVGYGKDGKSIAFGTTIDSLDQSAHGPLEKTILLGEAPENRIAVDSSVRSPSGFIRAAEQAGGFSLKLKPPGDTTLQILQGSQVKHEITADNTSGSRHSSYSLSPDGALIASGGDTGVLTLYSTGTGAQVASCVGHTFDVWSVAFAPDGKTLVSGSADQTVRLWEVMPTSCRNLLTIFAGSDNEWVVWTPQGYYASSANGDKYIGWHVNQGLNRAALFYPAAQFQKQFYRPDVVAGFLKTRNIEIAVKQADAARGIGTASAKVLGPADVLNYPPPRIVVAEPFTEKTVVRQSTFRIRAVAVADLPITGLEVLVNGVCQAGCSTGPQASSEPEKKLEAELVLQPGENKVDFYASHAKARSKPKEILVTYQAQPGEGKRDRPKLIVLAIGVSSYEIPRFKLDWAAKDALDVESAFLSQKGSPLYSDVLHHHIVDREVTANRILDELKWLNDQGGDDDIRVVFISGHGGLDSFGNYYFYAFNHNPADPAYNDLRWQTLLERLTSPNRKAVLMLDTCHAGAVASATDPRARGEVNFDEVLSEMKSKFRGLFTLAASVGTESSWEKKEWQHGAFTKAFLETLTDRAAIGKVLSTDDITYRVKEGVKGLKVDQHPTSTYTPSLTSFPLFMVQASGRYP